MSWAARRRLLILAIIATVALVVLAIVFFTAFYRAPSCVDGVQNQGEAGIDCGGPCPYLCQSQVQAPVVRFTQTFSEAAGRANIVASIDNPNQGAYARNVAYQIALYGADRTLAVPTIAGTIDIPPGATVPVFIPNINSGATPIATAFLTLDASTIKWQSGTDTRTVPVVANQTLGGTASNPRITATLTNPSVTTLINVKVIVEVFDTSGNVMAASQTVLPTIAGQGSATAIFTWNAAFSGAVARIDVMPVVPFP